MGFTIYIAFGRLSLVRIQLLQGFDDPVGLFLNHFFDGGEGNPGRNTDDDPPLGGDGNRGRKAAAATPDNFVFEICHWKDNTGSVVDPKGLEPLTSAM